MKKAEEHFDAVFDKIYEDRFIGTIFKNNAIISKESFIAKICPNKSFKSTTVSLIDLKKKKKAPVEPPIHDIDSDKNMVWLFSPSHLRKAFFEDLDFHLKNDIHEDDSDE